MTEKLTYCGICPELYCVQKKDTPGRVMVKGEAILPIRGVRIEACEVRDQFLWEAEDMIMRGREDDALRNDFETGFEPDTDYLGL